MPPNKRAMAEADPNEQASAGRRKKNKTKKAAPTDEENVEPNLALEENNNSATEAPRDEHADLLNRPPFEYYCMVRPFFDRQNENRDKPEKDQFDDDDLIDAGNKDIKDPKSPGNKPAADFPEHKWIGMWKSWTTYADWRRLTTYTDPDNFDMYIYNDFHGYGIQELIENLLLAFDKNFKKTKRDEAILKGMWATLAGLVLWLLDDDLVTWIGLEDGYWVAATCSLIRRAFISSLNELDRADLLRTDSEIKDLGLVMSLYLVWSRDLDDHDSLAEGDEDYEWAREILAYAEKAGVDLASAGCYGVEDRVEELEKEHGKIEPLKGVAKADRWSWKKNFKEYSNSNAPIGGEVYNILKMSHKERAGYNFDRKDPLKDIPEKDLREGNIMLA